MSVVVLANASCSANKKINSMVSVKVEALQKKAQSVRIIELSETLMRWSQTSTVVANLESLGKLQIFIACRLGVLQHGTNSS